MKYQQFSRAPFASGFSLIEVLIAVLVLATGMLALAALQASLTRSSVDARNRSQASAVAVETIEQIRSSASNTSADYEGLAVTGDAWSDWQDWTAPMVAGAPTTNVEFEWRSRVQRYVRDSTNGGCAGSTPPCFRVATAADDYETSGVSEFKRIEVGVRWTTDTGTHDVTFSDIVSATTREKARAVAMQNPDQNLGFAQPIVQIKRPNDIGIIPIGIGGGKETAASNPKPELGRERGRTDETSFQVYTYQSLDGGVAQLNRVIDTKVLGCRCLASTAVVSEDNEFLTMPVEPTFWDGSVYTEPVSGEASNTRGAPNPAYADVQSQLCTSCCQDHHDITGQDTKWDPFRDETQHLHYGDPDKDGDLDVVSDAGSEYFEVCRFIRVNGIFRAATDTRLRVMNLLQTTENLSVSEPDDVTGDPTPVDTYQNMVKYYVGAKAKAPNAEPDLSSFSIWDQPDLIKLAAVGSKRFLHNRALYIDHLEPKAQTIVTQAIEKCASDTEAALAECVLPYLPLVSLNATDIAQWDNESSETLTVTGFGYNPVAPPKGNQAPPAPTARGLTTAAALGEDDIIVDMFASNSGVADTKPIDPEDGSLVMTDSQDFAVGEVVDPGCEVPKGKFTVTQSGVTIVDNNSSTMGVSWLNPNPLPPECPNLDTQGVCSKAGTEEPFPATCQPALALPASTGIRIGGFTYEYSGPGFKPCGSGQSKNNVYCRNFEATGVSVNGTDVTALSTIQVLGLDGTASEEVRVIVPLMTEGGTMNVQFKPTYSDLYTTSELVGEWICDTSVKPSKAKFVARDVDGNGQCN